MSEVSKMSVKDWLVTYLIASVPLVGLIMMFIWAFGDSANETKKTWAKASIIWGAIMIAVMTVFYGAVFAIIAATGLAAGMQ